MSAKVLIKRAISRVLHLEKVIKLIVCACEVSLWLTIISLPCCFSILVTYYFQFFFNFKALFHMAKIPWISSFFCRSFPEIWSKLHIVSRANSVLYCFNSQFKLEHKVAFKNQYLNLVNDDRSVLANRVFWNVRDKVS